MTRKITLSLILIIAIIVCFQSLFGNQEYVRKHFSSVSQLKSASKELKVSSAKLEQKSTTEFENKKEELSEIIKEYKNAKEQYESVVPQYTAQDADALLAGNDTKDIYDVDFLWTIIGNYATEEGVNLKFDVIKNTDSASSLNNNSGDYIVCDLKFVITGNYIGLTDFIYDLEDDDRLNFEINDFNMQMFGEDLQVTLNVKEIKVNSSNLIENSAITNTVENVTETIEESGEKITNSVNNAIETQTVDSTVRGNVN